MAVPRPPISAHDAEEAMRPYLARCYDAGEHPESPAYVTALAEALDAACGLLGLEGVQR